MNMNDLLAVAQIVTAGLWLLSSLGAFGLVCYGIWRLFRG
jgi:hypothetical protein